MAGYFSYLPNIYIAKGVDNDEPTEYALVKNIFRRLAVADLNQRYTAFERARIEEGDTPSSIATEYYGDPFMDWCIMLTNNITNLYEQWPKHDTDFLDYVIAKYGDDLGAVHHYETKLIEYEGDTIVPEGIEVNENFTVTMPDGTVITKANTRVAITNYDYEEYENEQKKWILIPTPTTVALMKDELEEKLTYKKCPELDEQGNKKTPMSLVGRFLSKNTGVTRQQLITLDPAMAAPSETQSSASVGSSSTSETVTPTTTPTTSTTTPTTSTTSTSTTNTTTSSTSSGSSSSSSSSGGGYGGY